ncbi:hypothetical protein HOLleu_21417 [Holothuria leucospilota]|uniref:NACHT domain-containing protein n=1 Tax=Holothuria leucospilota TaxID=206669 RepID=A0A9Q1BXW3_HOLLE|nr:hypothetical protein HOLleu_21417 [Holothuria leucospilota]
MASYRRIVEFFRTHSHSGGNNNTDRTALDLYSDSREKPKLVYSRQYEKYSTQSYANVGRLVAFLESPDKIVTCVLDSLEIYELSRERVLKSLKVAGKVECLTTNQENIFTTFWRSNRVTMYDEDLNIVKTIVMEGMQDGDYPYDLAATSEGLFVCTFSWPAKAQTFNKNSGNLLCEFKNTTRNASNANSITVSMSLGLVSVLWDWNQILFYALSDNTCILVFESGSARIRISDQGSFVTGSRSSCEVKMYDMAELFTYSHFKEKLVSLLQKDDCLKLINHFAVLREQSNEEWGSTTPATALLLALEEKGMIDTSNIDRLADAFASLDIEPSCYHIAEVYQKTRMQATFYGTFLATLSAHLTSTLAEDLCTYFVISEDTRKNIVSSRDPGLALLLVLDEEGIISSSDVGALEEPLAKFKLLQALAKIHEYQSAIEDEDDKFTQGTFLSIEDKRALFLKCIQRKIQDWYETMTPVPWKKSCKWRAADLFVGSGLILTRFNSHESSKDIDEKCKLHYTEILTHESLVTEYRIILEGDPGSGKTMLASQLAYDWSQGKFSEIKLLILLPLKFVKSKTLVQAIKEFYFPRQHSISIADIEFFLLDGAKPNYLLLDGLEEYNPRLAKIEQSEVMKIMSKVTYTTCKVIVTSRSDFVQDLLHYPMLRLGRFGETERDCYLAKVYSDNIDRVVEVKEVIEKSPFLLDLCSVPLLFVLAVQNIEGMVNMRESHLSKVAPFMSNMVNTLCPTSGFIDNKLQLQPQIEQYIKGRSFLERCSFNGLCKGQQQLSWPKKFIDINVLKSKQWIDSGVFVVEEGLIETGDRDRQTMSKADANRILHGEGEFGTNKIGSLFEESIIQKRDTLQSDIPTSTGTIVNVVEHQSEAGGESGTLPTSIVCSVPNTQNTSLSQKSKQEVDTCDSTAKHFPLHIRFLHKIIQEWFAAKYFSQQIKQLKKKEIHLNEHLPFIRPTDLHYVLRFTCALYPPCFHVIVTHLIQYYQSEEGIVPKYILDCIFLCFAEYDGPITHEVLDAVTEVCKHGIAIQSGDSRLLQQAKVSMLELACKYKVPTKKLLLADLLVCASDHELTFNTGVKLGVLNTIEMIEITQWNQHLKERDYDNTVKFISKCRSLKTTSLHFPVQPPDINKETQCSLEMNNTTITWIIGKRLRHILDTETGLWKIGTEEVTQAEPEPDCFEDESIDTMLSTVEVISSEGGTIGIQNTDVKLEILPNALPGGMDSCRICLKIVVNVHAEEQPSTFGSNCSVVVELLPNNLKLRRPALLTLPHCLQLKRTVGKNVTVFMSHHEKGSEVKWERTEVSYQLDEEYCIIHLRSFCWVKYNIDDKIVEAKKILVYTAKEKIAPDDNATKIDVAYRLNLPGAKEILQMNKNLIVGEERPFLFFKDGRYPLHIMFSRCTPERWKYCTPDENPKIISFGNIEASVESSCPFTFVKITKGASFCTFKVSQMSDNIELTIPLKIDRNDDGLLHILNMEESPQAVRDSQPCNSVDSFDGAVRPETCWKRTKNEKGDDAERNLLTINKYKNPSEYAIYTEGKRCAEQSMFYYREERQQKQYDPLISNLHPIEHADIFPAITQCGGNFQQQAHAEHADSRWGTQFRYGILNEIAKDLDPCDPLGNDWRLLADELGFTMRDINAFKSAQRPTLSVCNSAVKRGKLKSVKHLKATLEKIGRIDAALHISEEDIQRSKSLELQQQHLGKATTDVSAVQEASVTAAIAGRLCHNLYVEPPDVKTNSETFPPSRDVKEEDGQETEARDFDLDTRTKDLKEPRLERDPILELSNSKKSSTPSDIVESLSWVSGQSLLPCM